MSANYRARIRLIHRALGIPASYPAQRRLLLQPKARRLVTVALAVDDGKPVRLAPRAALAWKRMGAAAAREGIELLPLSGFRSVTRQAEIIRQKLAGGQPLTVILQLVAAPGYSEHHSGCAVDIGSPGDVRLDEQFAKTEAFRWLKQRAGDFGFRLSYPRNNVHGFAFEPWHWCWRS